MYETYLRLGYSEDFVKASQNNWELTGIQLAEAVVKATKQADMITENRISLEWFNAYREAFESIVRSISPLLQEEEEKTTEVNEVEPLVKGNSELPENGIALFSKQDKKVNSVPHSFVETLTDSSSGENSLPTLQSFDGKILYSFLLKEFEKLFR